MGICCSRFGKRPAAGSDTSKQIDITRPDTLARPNEENCQGR